MYVFDAKARLQLAREHADEVARDYRRVEAVADQPPALSRRCAEGLVTLVRRLRVPSVSRTKRARAVSSL